MKTILRGTVAALALVAFAGSAQAQTAQLHYAGGPVSPLTNPTGFGLIGAAANEFGLLLGVGTRYTAVAGALGDTQTATPTVTVAFTLTGSVNKDCSFYAGNTAAATAISFGTIGIRTGNNENVGDAFEMVGPAAANINTVTAGCNFNNTVSLAKQNTTQGMVNSAPGGYDSNQFQANIPYSVLATWTGIAQNTVGGGIPQNINVATTAAGGSLTQGAWRSGFNLAIVAPVAPKGLVAGNYSDTLTLTLAAM